MGNVFGYDKVLERVLEGPPLLMLDRFELAADGRSARAVKAVSIGEAFFQGHFPNQPILPGVLQIAAMTQLSSVLLLQGQEAAGIVPWLAELKRVKFRRPVLPGDLMVVESELVGDAGNGRVEFKTTTRIGTEVACSGHLFLAKARTGELVGQPKPLVGSLRQWDLPENSNSAEVSEILEMIPHRFPFMFVDRILHMERERAVGVKNISGNEWFFRHAAVPVLPLYFQLEIAAQIACASTLSLPENKNKLGFFMSIDEGAYLYPVTPGDQLVFDVRPKPRGRFGIAEAEGYVGERMVSRGVVKFAIVDRDET